MALAPLSISVRPGYPDFLDLPWDRSLNEWEGYCERLEEVPRGLSRHPVVFVNYDGSLYALKEMPPDVAKKEYDILKQIEDLHLPAVTPVGHVLSQIHESNVSVLLTRFLDRSLPYRSLFMRSTLENYRGHLLDAMAGLLVQLHLAGIYWGDCSLSNVLFRRDAGALQAYLVDAETAEAHTAHLSPTLRHHDLEIMEENVRGDLSDLAASGFLSADFPILDTGAYIRHRYQDLWEEITREVIISQGEHYRIQERINALNALGFSVGEVKLQTTEGGGRIRLRVMVTDRNFHRDQFYGLTGLEAEEMQAQKMMNEIQEIKATLEYQNNRSTPLSVAAYQWMEHVYQPTIQILRPLVNQYNAPAELYCQVLEHKWFLSERTQHDVGHHIAAKDYLEHYGRPDSYQSS
jgi:tRNA A-37 threonylcarbamoyl transferase component Bud32